MRYFFPSIILVALISLSFIESKSKLLEFSYPGRSNTKLSMLNHSYGKFTTEWKGTDYYYLAESKDSIICSVFYFKLNEQEQKMMVTPFGDSIKAGIPYTFFSMNSQLRKYEANKVSWGEITDEFMFRQNDIILTPTVKQKHMYGYCRFGNDLFVSVHFSKANCSASDSIAMRQMLASLRKD
jgi:hypothetical protein